MKRVRAILRAAAFAATAGLLPSCSDDTSKGSQFGIVTVRVSVGDFGQEAFGDSNQSSLSADGRFVAFASGSATLTDGDANGKIDIFLKDRQTGVIKNLTNIDTIGTVMADCAQANISANGKFVAFVSTGNYTGDITNPGGTAHIFVYDVDNDVFRTTWVFPTPVVAGAENTPSLSADGRYLAFTTDAANVGGPGTFTTAGLSNIYLCDFGPTGSARIMTLVSHEESSPTSTTGSNGLSAFSSLASNASYVCFSSQGTNLHSALDADNGFDVYVWERATGIVTLASRAEPSGGGTIISFFGRISGDGTTVVYTHRPNAADQGLYLYNIAGLATTIITPSGIFVPNFDPAAISDDGQSVLYVGDTATTTTSQVYLWETAGGNQLISVSTAGAVGNKNSFGVSISGDGRWGAWTGLATNLVAGDKNGSSDIFVRGSLR